MDEEVEGVIQSTWTRDNYGGSFIKGPIALESDKIEDKAVNIFKGTGQKVDGPSNQLKADPFLLSRKIGDVRPKANLRAVICEENNDVVKNELGGQLFFKQKTRGRKNICVI